MFKFENYYTENKNFMGGISQEQLKLVLRSRYPEFYLTSEALNYKKIETVLNIDSADKKFLQTNLIELIKNLYSPRIKLIGQRIFYDTFPALLNMSNFYGNNIIAHGVEEEKGGMTTLLLIALTGYISITKKSWGTFTPGSADFSPLAHGPYYIIYKTNYSKANCMKLSPGDDPLLKDMEYVLVPFREQVEILKTKAEKMYEDGILDINKKEVFFEKLIDYQTFAEAIFEKYQNTPFPTLQKPPVQKRRPEEKIESSHVLRPKEEVF